MEKKLVIANWKSNKTVEESITFLNELKNEISSVDLSNKEIVVCPPFPSLFSVTQFVKDNNMPVFVGAQNISPFDDGAYTGEVSGKQIKNVAEYVIIGHSERRKYFQESNEQIKQKIEQARKNNLVIVLCVQDENDPIIQDVPYIAYEPPTAISTFGTGVPDDPHHVEEVFKTIAGKTKAKLIYGGSVKDENIASYAHIPTLSGFLIGGASLTSSSFIKLLTQW